MAEYVTAESAAGPVEELDVSAPEDSAPFTYTVTEGIADALARLNATLWVSTYQVGKLAVFREVDGRVSMLPRTFDKAMGFAVDQQQLSIATRYQVWTLKNETILAPRLKPEGTHDGFYLPRSSHVTGNIDAHEVAFGNEEPVAGSVSVPGRTRSRSIWVVNTLFSCLCTLDSDYSFVPRWRPPFVTRQVRQDRCHLNGLAMQNGQPKYVTCFAATDTYEGWREHKRDGGLLIDVPTGEIVARGFSMPHSPRIHQGKIYLLDSGNARLVTVDPRNGQADVVAEFPGYTRGLAIIGRYAFVGLSQVREKKIFGGVPVSERAAERRCGIWMVDLSTGRIIGQIEFEQTIQEIFDVQVLPGFHNPAVIGFSKETIQRACIIGPDRPLHPVTPPDSASDDDRSLTASITARSLNQQGLRHFDDNEKDPLQHSEPQVEKGP
jgi:uncharacterized protein (TIGR03032 family)